MDLDIIIRDYKEREIKVGTRCLYGSPPTTEDIPEYLVTVTDISDLDGDYDDELGRAVQVNPIVTVRFDDGTEDRLSTTDTTPITWNDYPHGPSQLFFETDDLEVYLPA